MSEYQRYEFMTIDQPLTRAQLDAVNDLSSHIEATSTHAFIEYNWGDFKHDPIKVLHKFFDGFLYWANWGTPQFALRFPHGILPTDLIDGYDPEDFIAFTQHPDYDILHIHFDEMEEAGECDLGSLIAIRDELMEGDMRALYIVWLAGQRVTEGYDDDEDKEDDENEEIIAGPTVPPGLGKLTAAQQELANLLQVPEELLVAAAQHNKTTMSSTNDDFVAWVELLPQERRNDYLVQLARNKPGLSRLLVKELRILGGSKKATPATSEQISYPALLAESQAIKARQLAESKAIAARLAREKEEQEQLDRQQHLQYVHEHQDKYWQRVDLAVTRKSSVGYDEATQRLIDLRDAADRFKETQAFETRFRAWVPTYTRRPAFMERLRKRNFPLP